MTILKPLSLVLILALFACERQSPPLPDTDQSRTLKTGQTHTYTLVLNAGEYVHLEVQQQGADVDLKLLDHNRKTLLASDSLTHAYGAESFAYIAPETQNLQVQISAGPLSRPPYRYQLTVKARRQAIESDQAMALACKTWSDARQNRLQSNHAETAALFQKAADLWRDCRQPNFQAEAQFELGVFYYDHQNYHNARQALEQAYELFLKEGGNLKAAFVAVQLGRCYRFTQQHHRAEFAWDSAIRLAKLTHGDGLLAYIQMEAAFHFYRVGQHEKAIALLESAGRHDDTRDDHPTQLRIFLNLAINHILIGNLDQARACLQTAETHIDQMTETNGERALVYAWLGRVYDLEKNHQAAERSFKRALTESKTNRNTYLDLVYGLQAAFYQEAGKLNQAAEAYREWSARLSADSEKTAHYHLNLAGFKLRQKDYQAAIDFARQGYTFFQQTGEPNAQARALFIWAYALHAMDGDRHLVREKLDRAVALWDTVRENLGSPNNGMAFARSRDVFYQNVLTICNDLDRQFPHEGWGALAFSIAERRRARVLFRMANSANDINAELKTKLQAIAREIDRQEHQRLQGANNEQNIRGLLSQRDRLLAEMPIAKTQPINLSHIQTELLTPDSAILAFALGDEKSHAWLVTQAEVTMYELPARDKLAGRVRPLYELLSTPNTNQAQRDHLLHWLGETLLNPIQDKLQHKHLILLKDDILHYLPFALLPNPNAEGSLIDRHNLSVQPSATYAVFLRRLLAQRPPAPFPAAIIADPVVSLNQEPAKQEPAMGESLRRSMQDMDLTELKQLPYTSKEAEAIAQLIPAAKKLTGPDAQRDKLLAADPGRYRILHFATHGMIHPQHQALSGIVLSLYDDQGRPTDGFLRAHQLALLDLPVELVTLSACNTALGETVAGEGLWGLTRGLMVAGAARIVGSLWYVDDRATADLMKCFYQRLMVARAPVDQALTQAQREIRATKEFEDPYYWAAFELQGAWWTWL